MIFRKSFYTSLATACLLFAIVLTMVADASSDPIETTTKQQDQITIAKETTRILGPLREDGYVDYVAALNELCSKGVTPENNVVVPLVKAMGSKDISESIRDEYFKRLGIPALPEKGSYFVDFYNFTAKRREKMGEKLDNQLDRSMTTPWSAKKFPAVSQWIDANAEPLRLAVEGSNRSRYYVPLVSTDENAPTIAIMLPMLAEWRSVARALAARAMRSLGSGDVDAACTDLLACHRLGRLIGQGPTLIDGLVSIAIDGIACRGDATMATSGKLSAEQAKKYLAQLERLPRLPSMIEKINFSERYMFLDCVASIARTGPGALNTIACGEETSKSHQANLKALANELIDWDEVLREGNRWYDRMVEIGRKPTYKQRARAWQKFDEDIQTTLKEASGTKNLFMHILSGKSSEDIVTELMSNTMLALLLPAVSKAAEAEDRSIAYAEVTRVAIALSAYHADHEMYPKKLKMLAPTYISEIPSDRFTDEELIYRRAKTGFSYTVSVQTAKTTAGAIPVWHHGRTTRNTTTATTLSCESRNQRFERRSRDLPTRSP